MSSVKRETLTGLLEKELELFEQVYEICMKQTRLIEQDEYEELDASTAEVNKLREKINGLHQESETLMQSRALSQDWESAADSAGGAASAAVKELSEKISALIGKCATLNEQNMSLMKAKQEAQTKKIDEQRAKREGIGGYAQAFSSNPEMFDKKM